MCGLDCSIEDDESSAAENPSAPNDGDPAAVPTGSCNTSTDCPSQAITTIRIVGVTFRSDHERLKDHEAVWEDGGIRYPKPEWTPSNIHPISQTQDTPLSIELALEVEPQGARTETVTLLATDGDSERWFEHVAELHSGTVVVAMTSTRRLPTGIGSFLLELTWYVKGTSATLENQKTAHPILYTMGMPTTPDALPGVLARPGITVARLRHAVNVIEDAHSMDPHKIVEYLVRERVTFNLKVTYENAWVLENDNLRKVGADCQTIVRYARKICMMVGLPGSFECVVVWAKAFSPAKAEENPAYAPNMLEPPQRYNQYQTTNDFLQGLWVAMLVDRLGGQNIYETCLRYTHSDKTVYYAGGAGAFDSADEVLRGFASMSWIDLHTMTTKEVIYEYKKDSIP